MKSLTRLTTYLWLIPAALVPAAAFAQTFTPTAQTRYVYTSAYASDPEDRVEDADYEEATDFGRFNAFIGSTASQGGAVAVPTSEINSVFEARRIAADGDVDANASINDLENETAGSTADSVFYVEFTVDVTTPFRLRGSISTVNGSSYAALYGPSGIVFETTGDNEEFDFIGTLAGGAAYALYADGGTGASVPFGDETFDAGMATYDVALTVIPAVREFTPISQFRDVSGNAFARDSGGISISDSDSRRAFDFAPWSERVSVSAARGGAAASAAADQKSSFGPL